MIVATYDNTNNQQIDSTVKAFGNKLIKINSWKDIDGDIVFCVDKQTAQEIGNLYFVNELRTFRHDKNYTYVFGLNTSQKLAKEIMDAMEHSKHKVQILTISGKTLWAESALAIVLYDYDNR